MEWVPEDVRGNGSRGLQRLEIQPVRNERAEHPRRTIGFVNTYRPCKSTVQPVDPTARAREIAANSHLQWTTDADAFRLERFQRISCLDPSVHGVWAHICEMCKKATVDLARDVCRFAILDVLVTLPHKQQDIRATAQLLPRGGERLAQLCEDWWQDGLCKALVQLSPHTQKPALWHTRRVLGNAFDEVRSSSLPCTLVCICYHCVTMARNICRAIRLGQRQSLQRSLLYSTWEPVQLGNSHARHCYELCGSSTDDS